MLRQADDGSFRIEPVERRQPEMTVSRDDLNGAEKGDLVEVEQVSSARATACRAGALSRGSDLLTSEKAVSMIAIHAHEIRISSRPTCWPRPRRRSPPPWPAARTFRDLPLITIDPAGRQGS